MERSSETPYTRGPQPVGNRAAQAAGKHASA